MGSSFGTSNKYLYIILVPQRVEENIEESSVMDCRSILYITNLES